MEAVEGLVEGLRRDLSKAWSPELAKRVEVFTKMALGAAVRLDEQEGRLRRVELGLEAAEKRLEKLAELWEGERPARAGEGGG